MTPQGCRVNAVPDLDGWTCPGRADLLASLSVCPACGAGTRLTAYGAVCDARECPDPWRAAAGPLRAAGEDA
jgi:hypothetical protein